MHRNNLQLVTFMSRLIDLLMLLQEPLASWLTHRQQGWGYLLQVRATVPQNVCGLGSHGIWPRNIPAHNAGRCLAVSHFPVFVLNCGKLTGSSFIQHLVATVVTIIFFKILEKKAHQCIFLNVHLFLEHFCDIIWP